MLPKHLFNSAFNKFKYYKSVLLSSPGETSTEHGRSIERNRRVALSVICSIFTKGITMLTGFVSVPLTVNYLGEERYGLWMAISSALAFLTFADLGLGNGLLNAIANANGKDDQYEASQAVSSAFFMLLSISILLGGIFVVIYPFISWPTVFNVKTQVAQAEVAPAMVIVIGMFLLNMPLGIVQRVQMGYQEGYKNEMWLALGAILGLVGVLMVIKFEGGLPWLIFAITGGPILALLLNASILFIKDRPWLFPSLRMFKWSTGQRLAGVGLIFFLLQFFTIVSSSSDNIVIAKLIGAAEVAEYAVTKKVFMMVQISQFLIVPLWPAFGEAMARKDYRWAKRTLMKTLFVSLACGIVVSLPLLLFGRQIIGLWVGDNLAPSWPLLIGFFIWMFQVNYGGTMSVFLNNGDLLKRQALFIGASAISSVILQIILVPYLGISGAIWACILGYGIFYVIPAYRLSFGILNKYLKLSE